MGLERRGAFLYYYQKSRVDGKVVSKYIGQGALAHFAAWSFETDRTQRDIDRHAALEFMKEQRRIDHAIDKHHSVVHQLVTLVLQAMGFHQHKRQWRKKRQGEDRSMANEAAVQAGKKIFEEYNKLLAATNIKKPKPADLERLREYGLDHPGIFEGVSMLAKTTIDDVIDSTGTSEGVG